MQRWSSSAINTFLGNLKTAYSGTYLAFDFSKYAHRYLAEVSIDSTAASICRSFSLACSGPRRLLGPALSDSSARLNIVANQVAL